MSTTEDNIKDFFRLMEDIEQAFEGVCHPSLCLIGTPFLKNLLSVINIAKEKMVVKAIHGQRFFMSLLKCRSGVQCLGLGVNFIQP